MALNTTGTPGAFLPEDFGTLLIATASKQSVALQTTNVVSTDSTEFRIPIVTGDPTAGWYTEGAEIDLDDPDLSEEVVRPRKVAGLAKISNELAGDSNPAAAQVVGQSIARSIAIKIDEALFGTNNGTGTPPKGLGAITDPQLTAITAGTTWTNIDPFVEAQFKVDAQGGSLTAFIANPSDAETLAKLKRETGSNEPLLAPDAATATRRTIAGTLLYTSIAVPAGTIYGLDQSRVFTVLRNNVAVETDRSAYFSADSTAIRAIARVGFGYPHSKTIARIKLGS